MSSKVKFHTVEQPDSDITTFVLSCNRLDVLEKTIETFLATKDYVTKMVIVDDSAEEGVFEILSEKYGSFSDIICFPKNRSQWWAMDFMVSYCDTDYIFYLEDDWEFKQTGYLQKSKEILQNHRNIGTVDISWRTFEWQGFDSYHKELIDDSFYYKKPWKISDYHLSWYGWIGSPNLKRRDDLILLGRVEKWHNEWNIDRKFLSMGFKSVFLNGEYVTHLGDHCSRMDGKRPDDGTTPEHYYPQELQADRIWPKLDYMFLDAHWKSPLEVTMVTAILDINRGDRDFEAHYLEGIKKVLECRNPMIIYAEDKWHDWIREHRGTLPSTIISFSKEILEKQPYFSRIQSIIQTEEFQSRSHWIKGSALCNPWYIPLTLHKMVLLKESAQSNPYNSNKFYWIDSGIYNSFGITEHIDTFNFNKIPDSEFFITSYPYWTNTEIHGYDINHMTELCENMKPNFVCRASLFGGTRKQIEKIDYWFDKYTRSSLNEGFIGTEESIYTIIGMNHEDSLVRHEMPNGDIKNFLNKIRSR